MHDRTFSHSDPIKKITMKMRKGELSGVCPVKPCMPAENTTGPGNIMFTGPVVMPSPWQRWALVQRRPPVPSGRVSRLLLEQLEDGLRSLVGLCENRHG